MLKFGNKEFRNLQEQVLKNMRDIENLVASGMILDEFGIKVVGQEASIVDMPTVEAYKEAHEDWAYGDAYAIGTEEPYTLYILTRANETHAEDYWFDIGEFPAVGPEGPQGPQGEVGPQGQTGATGPAGQDGEDAGFGTVSATAHTLDPEESATASVTVSGPDTAKNFYFEFGIPKGQDGSDITVDWGEIEGTLANQTDLVTALQGKQNTLVSGTNIKTINNTSILGQGNIDIQSAVWGNITGTLSNQTDLQTALNGKLDKVTTATAYGQVYAKDISGNQAMIDFSTSAANSIVRRNGSHLYAGTSTDVYSNTDAVPKYYVDNYHDSTKQDAIADLSTIRAGAAAGATAVQPAAIANMVTTTGTQTISGDKTLSGILNKNTNGYGVVMPSTTSYTQNKTIATTDLVREIYQHYITFKANSNKTVISVKVLTQSNTPMTASEFFSFVNDELPDATGNIVATGTIHISNLDHKYVGAIGKGSSSSAITVYPLVSTGGYDSIVSLAASAVESFVDIVDRVGAHGAGSSGSIITRQDIIDALGYIPSHVDANPSSTTGTLTGIGIDGVSYAIQGGGSGTITDVEVNGTSVVSGTVANIDLTAYVLAANLADVATTGSYNDLINKPTIPVVPTDVSAFNNDAGYITSSALSGYATESYVQGYHDSTKQDVISDLSTIRSGAALGATAVQPAAISDMATETWVGQQGYLTSVSWSDVSGKPTFATVATSGSYNDLSDKPTIPDTTYMVTTNTTQTITGEKTFTGDTYLDSLVINNESFILHNTTTDCEFEITCAPTLDRTITLPDKDGTVALTSDIPSVSNFVTLNTAQNISANKTFTSGNKIRFIDNNNELVYEESYDTSSGHFETLTETSAEHYYNTDYYMSVAGDTIITSGESLKLINNNGGGDYGILVPSCHDFTADKTIATTDQLFSGSYTDLSNKPDLSIYAQSSSLATVATSGSYNDLSNKPTIPVVNYPVTDVKVNNVSVLDGTVAKITMPTIPVTDVTVGGTSVVSSGVAAIPALFSGSYNDLTNKPDLSIYAQSANLATVATSGSYNDLSNKPSIPDIYYHNGDTFTGTANVVANGCITASSKQIILQIIVPKLLTNISSVTVNKCSCIFRGVAGYVNGSSNIDYASTSGYTLRADISSENTITLNIYGTNAFSSATNNTVMNALFPAGELQLTFNEA